MDQEQAKHWLKENWFKLGILITILIVAYSFYHTLVIKPGIERQREEAASKEAQLEEERNKLTEQEKLDQLKKDLNLCVSSAEEAYSNNWYGECKARNLLSQWCLDNKTISFEDYLKKQNLSEEEYKKQRGIESSTILSGMLDFFKRQNECSCMLPLAIADRLDSGLKDNKELCYKRYPRL